MANNRKNSSYELPVVDTISTAWDKVRGAKGSIWAAIGIMLAIMFGLGLVQGIFQAIHPALGGLANIIISLFNLLLQASILYMGIARALGKPLSYKLLFYTLNTTTAINVFILYILKFLILLIPILVGVAAVTVLMMVNQTIAVILGVIAFAAVIYLSLRLFVALGCVLDKGTRPIDAIKLSFEATRNNVLPLLGVVIIQWLIFIVAVIPLGIGLIWAIPLGLIVYGTVYKRLTSNV